VIGRKAGVLTIVGDPGQPRRDRTLIGPAEFMRKASMTKKIILLALAAASVAAFAMPAAATAITPLHIVPTPVGAKTIDGVGHASLKGTFGTITCTGSSGSATFESGTTGTFNQKFTGCEGPTGKCTTAGQPEKTIVTTSLPFHLATVIHEHNAAGGNFAGILVTPNTETGVFAHFACPLFPNVTVTGNGLVGTITKPECGKEGTEGTISFTSKSAGVQTHTTLTGTPLISYGLQAFSGNASEDAHGTITFGATATKLECT